MICRLKLVRSRSAKLRRGEEKKKFEWGTGRPKDKQEQRKSELEILLLPEKPRVPIERFRRGEREGEESEQVGLSARTTGGANEKKEPRRKEVKKWPSLSTSVQDTLHNSGKARVIAVGETGKLSK